MKEGEVKEARVEEARVEEARVDEANEVEEAAVEAAKAEEEEEAAADEEEAEEEEATRAASDGVTLPTKCATKTPKRQDHTQTKRPGADERGAARVVVPASIFTAAASTERAKQPDPEAGQPGQPAAASKREPSRYAPPRGSGSCHPNTPTTPAPAQPEVKQEVKHQQNARRRERRREAKREAAQAELESTWGLRLPPLPPGPPPPLPPPQQARQASTAQQQTSAHSFTKLAAQLAGAGTAPAQSFARLTSSTSHTSATLPPATSVPRPTAPCSMSAWSAIQHAWEEEEPSKKWVEGAWGDSASAWGESARKQNPPPRAELSGAELINLFTTLDASLGQPGALISQASALHEPFAQAFAPPPAGRPREYESASRWSQLESPLQPPQMALLGSDARQSHPSQLWGSEVRTPPITRQATAIQK